MNTTHTPGPWSVFNQHSTQVQIRDEAQEIVIAALPTKGNTARCLADARLMAAAPEMAEEHTEQAVRLRMWARALQELVDSAGTGWGEASGVTDIIEGLEISATKAEVLLAKVNGGSHE